MNVRLIFQGNNEKESVGSILKNSFEDDSYTRFIAFIAFASKAGTDILNSMLEEAPSHLEQIKIFLGVDKGGTSTEALYTLLDNNIDVNIVYTTSGSIFHPKIYLFTGPTKVRLIVGSSNLTHPGLFDNIEASAVLDFDSHDLADTEIGDTVEYILESLDTLFGANQQKLNKELIELLKSVGIVPSEANRTDRYGKDPIDSDNQKGMDNKEAWEMVKTFFPPLKHKSPSTRREKPLVELHAKDHTKSVLVAELPKGQNRWNQANFDIKTFKDFFGLTPGAKQELTLVPVLSNGTYGKPENRRNVSVKSHNYRIELGLAAHIGYPSLGRPICVFLKIKDFEFHYRLFLPTDGEYPELVSLLDEHSKEARGAIRRISLTKEEFSKKLPNVNL